MPPFFGFRLSLRLRELFSFFHFRNLRTFLTESQSQVHLLISSWTIELGTTLKTSGLGSAPYPRSRSRLGRDKGILFFTENGGIFPCLQRGNVPDGPLLHPKGLLLWLEVLGRGSGNAVCVCAPSDCEGGQGAQPWTIPMP